MSIIRVVHNYHKRSVKDCVNSKEAAETIQREIQILNQENCIANYPAVLWLINPNDEIYVGLSSNDISGLRLLHKIIYDDTTLLSDKIKNMSFVEIISLVDFFSDYDEKDTKTIKAKSVAEFVKTIYNTCYFNFSYPKWAILKLTAECAWDMESTLFKHEQGRFPNCDLLNSLVNGGLYIIEEFTKFTTSSISSYEAHELLNTAKNDAVKILYDNGIVMTGADENKWCYEPMTVKKLQEYKYDEVPQWYNGDPKDFKPCPPQKEEPKIPTVFKIMRMK